MYRDIWYIHPEILSICKQAPSHPKILRLLINVDLTNHGNPLELLLHHDLDVLSASRVGRSERGREEEEDVELGGAVVHDDETRLVGADRVARDGSAHAGHNVQQTLEEKVRLLSSSLKILQNWREDQRQKEFCKS